MAIPANTLLDTLLREQNLKNDAQLSVALSVGSPQLSKIRHGRNGVSDELRVAVMRTFSMTLVRLDELAPPKAKD